MFPAGCSAGDTAGIRPIAIHLRVIPNDCHWEGRPVLASDDSSIGQNPMAVRLQSKFWFGEFEQLGGFGPGSARELSGSETQSKGEDRPDPVLVAGCDEHILHMAVDEAELALTTERDRGRSPTSAPGAANGDHAHWDRLAADRDCWV